MRTDKGCCLCSLLSSAQRADTARDIRNFFPGLIGLEEQKEMQKGLLLNFPNSDEKDTKFHPDTWHTGPQHYTGMSPTCPQTRYAQRYTLASCSQWVFLLRVRCAGPAATVRMMRMGHLTGVSRPAGARA